VADPQAPQSPLFQMAGRPAVPHKRERFPPGPVSTALTSGLAVRLSGIPPLSEAGDITLEG
jgi:hypothetical protein